MIKNNKYGVVKTSLTYKEVNEFVDSVVDAAIILRSDEEGSLYYTYDPVAQLATTKVNILKYYCGVDIVNADPEELYEKCSGINMEELKSCIVIGQSDFNYIQLQDILKAIDMKIEYLQKEVLNAIIDKRSALDRLIDEVGDILLPFLRKLTDVGEINPEMINQFMEKMSQSDFQFNEKTLVDAVINKVSKQKSTEESSKE